jgi:hypothetical protein
MATDFSIELSAEQIVDPRSREYFREVYSSYTIGNYRSAVVMLWSVVVCDLLFKLEDLKARLDPAADAILTEIEAKQKESRNSPEWEVLLLDRVKEKTHLVDTVEHINLKQLQQHRHLSAHPVLTGTYDLFSPTRETVRAHIRSSLEGVLIKTALMSKKVFNALTEDLERLKEAMVIDLPDDDDLRRYLEDTYFKRMSLPVLESMFRSLWQIVFKKIDERCTANRHINYRALRLLYRRHASVFDQKIRGEPDYYSDVAVGGEQIASLIAFLADHPQPYSALTDAAKIPIKKLSQSSLERRAIAWFVTGDLKRHLEEITEELRVGSVYFGSGALRRLYWVAKDRDLHNLVIDMAIVGYVNSKDSYAADSLFIYYVKPYLGECNEVQLRALLDGIEKNDRTRESYQCEEDHALVKTFCDKVLGADFDYSQYPKFVRSMTPITSEEEASDDEIPGL